MNEILRNIKADFMTFMEIMSLMAGYLLAVAYNFFASIFGKKKTENVYRLKYSVASVNINDITASDILDSVLSALRAAALSLIAVVMFIGSLLYQVFEYVRDTVLLLFSKKYKTNKFGIVGAVPSIIFHIVIASGIIALGVLGTIVYAIVSAISALLRRSGQNGA